MTSIEDVSEDVEALVGINDFPSLQVALFAKQHGLIGTSPKSIANCQHKYISRSLQQQTAPNVTPDFALSNTVLKNITSHPIPTVIKPITSHLSLNTHIIKQKDKLEFILTKAVTSQSLHGETQPTEYSDLYSAQNLDQMKNQMLVEEYATGEQLTVDGFVSQGEVQFIGYTHSAFLPDTLSFDQFTFPYKLPTEIQKHVEDQFTKVVLAHELDNSMFNIEFKWDPETNTCKIIELNSRIASQFIHLIYQVTGRSPLQTACEVALGIKPEPYANAKGKHAVAASCVLRRQIDALTTQVPTQQEIDHVKTLYPDAQIVSFTEQGNKLSDYPQDTYTYRYAWVNIGGTSKQHIAEKLQHIQELLLFKFQEIK